MLLLDAGNVFGGDGDDAALQRKAHTSIAAMSLMGYDALNLGVGEFGLGRSVLEMERDGANFPFLSANVLDANSGERPYTPYVVKQAGRLKVGIIGLLSPIFYHRGGLMAQEPATALRAILPDVSTQADFIVVLAQMDFDEAVELARVVQDFQVMIVADGTGQIGEPLWVGDVLLAHCNYWGMSIDELRIVSNTNGQVIEYQWRQGLLDERVPDAPHMVELLQR